MIKINSKEMSQGYPGQALNRDLVAPDLAGRLKARDKEILTSIGLPHELLPDAMPELRATHLIKVGGRDGVLQFAVEETFVLALMRDGSIFCIDDAGPGAYVNDCLDSFLKFCIIFNAYCRNDDEKSRGELMDSAPAVRETLRVIDLSAFRDEESWWSVILEASEDGQW